MKAWLTAQEIAAAALPGLPKTERAIQIMAEREGWNLDAFRSRKRTGRGGGMEYDVGLLPSLAQVTYRSRSIPVARAPEAEAPSSVALSGRAALERDARLAILRAYVAFEKGQRLNRQGCECLFVSKYQAGTLQVEPWIRELIPSFSRRTLARWRAEAERDTGGLGFDRGAARKGKGVLETANGGAVRAFMLGLIAHQPHLTGAHVRTLCRSEFGDTLDVVRGGGVIEVASMPPVRTFQQALKTLKVVEKVALTKLTNPDKFRSHMKLAGEKSLSHVREPNTLWQIDASPVDALCTDGRHAIYVCIDIATRRPIFYMSKTPRASAVGLLLRKAILAWGVPAEIKTDNGSDFTAKASQRLLASLGIDLSLSDRYSPEQKGHVERLIGTFQRDAVTLLPGFVGHSVADRKVIENRRSFAQRLGEDDAQTFSVQCTAAEMQAHFDAWAELSYEQSPHKALGGLSPADVAASAAHTIRRVDLRALDLLLAPAASGSGIRTVMKTGIHIDNIRYLNGQMMPKRRVFVRMDPLDLGRIYLFEPDGETFIGEAENAAYLGIAPEAKVRAEREIQSQAVAEKTKAIEAVRRELRRGPHLAQRVRQVWERDRQAREGAKSADVVTFPRPEVEHSTPAIAAALDAATHREKAPVVTVSDKVAEAHARLREQVRKSPNVEPIRKNSATLETPLIRFRRALDLEARVAAGEAIDADELIRLGHYQATPQYRAYRREHDRQQARETGR